MELADWTSVTVTGADRQTFLNNFCTNDVKRLTPGNSCEAFFTDAKGKIVGHGLVMCHKDELVIVGVPGQGPRLVEHLDRYVIREDVQLRDTSSKRSYLLTTATEADEHATAWDLLHTKFCGLVATTAADLTQVRRSLVERGLIECSREAFETVRIESGTPLFGVDFDEQNLPQEVGRDRQAINFTKGCYLGQETVARIDALGHVNRRLAGVRFFGPEVPTAGTELRSAGTAAGHITSASFSPQLGAPLAIAMLRREHMAPESMLESAMGKCEVIALPLNA